MKVNVRPGRIRGLDGLRALAVVAVLIFHLRPASLPGGFIGVDIFFVVSGFLITTLLIRELSSTNYLDLPRFWLRRARRLLPPLVLVVFVSVTGGLFLGNDLLVGIRRQTLGALTFSTNWVEILAGSSYFAGTSPQLFAHFWSLAVEEQFYLLWPLLFLVLLAMVRKWKARVGVAVGGAILSALAMALLYTPGDDVTRVYYGTDTHAFGLFLGVALAFMWAGTTWLDSPAFTRLAPFLGPLALLSIGGLMPILNENSVFTFRGGLFVASLLTALLIACLVTHSPYLLTIAELPPITWLGERSYGIYLWHWPLILLLTALTPAFAIDSLTHWIVRALALAATLLLSALSYKYIEMPIRALGFRNYGRRALAQIRERNLAPKVTLAASILLVAGTTAGLITAPAKSAVQIAIEKGQQEIDGNNAQSGPQKSDDPKDRHQPTQKPSGNSTPPPILTANHSVPTGEEITGFGDSLLVTSTGGLTTVFPGIYLDAVSNRQWQHAEEIISTALTEGTVRRAVIIDFGTNAGIPDADVVRNVLDMLGPERMVVVVNLYGMSTFIEPANELLAKIVSDYPNTIVADWYSAVSAQPEMLQPDQTHPNMEGMQFFAETVQKAFQELSDRISALDK